MSEIRIHEVSLRDGLQNEPGIVATEHKIVLANLLMDAGVRDLEIGSFVSPRWVPQMADTDALFQRLEPRDGVRFWGLVPNRRGLERALEVGAKHVASFLSASETHNAKNLNRTVRESLAEQRKVIMDATSEGVIVRSYISTVFGCPYEGAVSVSRTLELAQSLLDFGAMEVALGDTTGMANPEQVRHVIRTLEESGIPLDRIAVHFHDTRGTAVANAYAAWKSGVRDFDGSVGGIGGCPYAPGASGNAATEDLIYLFHALQEKTGTDLSSVCQAGGFMEGILGRTLPGRYLKVWQSNQKSTPDVQSA